MQNKANDSMNKAIFSDFTNIWVYPNPHHVESKNPYLTLLYKGLQVLSFPKWSIILPIMALLSPKSLVHHHWFEFRSGFGFTRLVFRLFILLLYRLCGGTIYWTIHNILPHDAPMPGLQQKLRTIMANLSHVVLVHHLSHIYLVQKYYHLNLDKIQVLQHPDYELSLQSSIPDECVATFNERYPERFILIYGQVAPYKNTLKILQALKDHKVIVAGLAKNTDLLHKNYTAEVNEWVDSNDSHMWINRFVSREEEAWLHHNSLAVVFGFEKILYSGGVHLAHQYQSQFENRLQSKIILPKYPSLEFYSKVHSTTSQTYYYENFSEIRDLVNA